MVWGVVDPLTRVQRGVEEQIRGPDEMGFSADVARAAPRRSQSFAMTTALEWWNFCFQPMLRDRRLCHICREPIDSMIRLRDLRAGEYRALADLRYQIRRFLNFSEAAARAVDVEPQQHQLLLLLKAMMPETPTIRVVAERLQIRQNSAAELVKRSVQRGLVMRAQAKRDRREASVGLTPAGERVLRRLSLAHRDELRSAAPALLRAVHALLERRSSKKQARRVRTRR
jgi:DNA-binding MarR family transcriptional regulator